MKKYFFLIGLITFSINAYSDIKAVHGMLLFGQNAQYISHLSMLHEPHDYQFIAKVKNDDFQKQNIVNTYKNNSVGNDIFTIVPEPFDLRKLINKEITTFMADVYSGHFERGGTKIGAASFTIENIVVAHKIDKDNGPSSNFFSFGDNGEYYLAHEIKGQPTYDAIYLTKEPYKLLSRCFRICWSAEQSFFPSDFPLSISTTGDKYNSTHPAIGTITSREKRVNHYTWEQIKVELLKPIYVEYLKNI